MGYIREPKGVDFTVVPRTKPDPEGDRLFSEFLKEYKAKNKASIGRTVAKAKEIIRKYEASHI
jgi:hypothetical protein